MLGYFNEGSKQQPFWRKDTTVFAGIRTEQSSSPYLIDFDHDGDLDLDLISGNGWGGVHYFENQSYLSVQKIEIKQELDFWLFQNFPNPFNEVSLIKYQIAQTNQTVKLEIFNIMEKNQNPGKSKSKRRNS